MSSARESIHRRPPHHSSLLLLTFLSVAAVGWLSLSSRTTFHYWPSPFTIGKHDRFLIGVGHGDLYLAYGWPSQGRSASGLPQSEPIFGSETYEGEPVELSPGEATELATQQFSIKIDGVPHTDSFQIIRFSLLLLLLPPLLTCTIRLAPQVFRGPHRSDRK